MFCPVCGEKTKVIRIYEEDCETIRRIRECKNLRCNYQFYTVEVEDVFFDTEPEFCSKKKKRISV